MHLYTHTVSQTRIAVGQIYSFGVFLLPFADEFSAASTSTISWIGSIAMGFYLGGGVISGKMLVGMYARTCCSILIPCTYSLLHHFPPNKHVPTYVDSAWHSGFYCNSRGDIYHISNCVEFCRWGCHDVFHVRPPLRTWGEPGQSCICHLHRQVL